MGIGCDEIYLVSQQEITTSTVGPKTTTSRLNIRTSGKMPYHRCCLERNHITLFIPSVLRCHGIGVDVQETEPHDDRPLAIAIRGPTRRQNPADPDNTVVRSRHHAVRETRSVRAYISLTSLGHDWTREVE